MLDELDVAMLNYTRLGAVLGTVAPDFLADQARSRVEWTFTTAEQLAASHADRPRFVFVHVPAPHPPWVFGADGSPRDPDFVSVVGEPGRSTAEELEAGFDQASYIATRTVRSVDAVRTAAGPAPVIVVFSDHGPIGAFKTSDPLGSAVETRASDFLAASTPGHPGLMDEVHSPINLFPALFEAYLGSPHRPAARFDLGLARFLSRCGRGVADPRLDALMAQAMAAPATATGPRWWRDKRHLPWWRIPVYPAVFLPVMILLTWGQTGTHPALLVRSLLVSIGFSLVLTLLIAAVVKDRDRAGLAAAALLVAVLALDDRAAVMLVVAAVAVVVEGVIHRGRPAIVASIATQVMSAVAAILLIATAITLVSSGAIAGAVADVTKPPLSPIALTEGAHPDIYVFLLDAYPGDRAATHATSFDADAFPDALQARGFDVDRDSHSNYLMTPLTLVDDGVDASPRRHPGPRSALHIPRQRLVPGTQRDRIRHRRSRSFARRATRSTSSTADMPTRACAGSTAFSSSRVRTSSSSPS